MLLTATTRSLSSWLIGIATVVCAALTTRGVYVVVIGADTTEFGVGSKLELMDYSPFAIKKGVAIVTGGCGAIGSEIVIGLAAAGLDVLVPYRPGHQQVCRTKLNVLWPAKSNSNLLMLAADFANYTSTLSFVWRVRTDHGSQLKILVNCAGLITSQKTVTSDGVDMMFQVNLWAQHFLTIHLFPVLQSNAPASVVTVSSAMGDRVNVDFWSSVFQQRTFDPTDWQFARRQFYGTQMYSQTKVGNRMLTWEAHRRYKGSGVVFNAVHPGFLASPLVDRAEDSVAVKSPEVAAQVLSTCCDEPWQTAYGSVWLAVNAPAYHLSGSFWSLKNNFTRRQALDWNDEKQAAKLWDLCTDLLPSAKK